VTSRQHDRGGTGTGVPVSSKISDICEIFNLLLFFSYFACQNKEIKSGVEFALHSQHETSCDSETQTKEDFKTKFRKQLGSLELMSLNSTDKEEALDHQC